MSERHFYGGRHWVPEERAERAEADRDRLQGILRELQKAGRLWVDQADLQAARVRVVYQDEHESEVARLKAALEQVEWCEVDGSVFCPWCEVSGFNGCVEHAPDCPRQVALRGEGREGER